MYLIMLILENKLTYFREKYKIHHDFSNLNKAIEQIEQAAVLSSEEQSLIDMEWSLILVKSNQFDFVIINYICLLVDYLITVIVCFVLDNCSD